MEINTINASSNLFGLNKINKDKKNFLNKIKIVKII